MVQKIVFTGAESSGKTTVCAAVAAHLGLPFVPEFARTYLASKPDFKYAYADLEAIALGQKADETAHAASAAVQQAGLLLCDTDILTLKIWAEVVFGRCAEWFLTDLAEADATTHYFLCHYEDVAWEPDPLRENPTDRDRIFDIYVQNLNFFAKNYTLLRGGLSERVATVLKVVADLMSKNSQTKG